MTLEVEVFLLLVEDQLLGVELGSRWLRIYMTIH
jgi:hypothetical protein